MNTESVNFIKDHALILKEKYNESLAKINEADIKGEDSSFYKGQSLAYYEKEVNLVVPEFGKQAT